MFAFLLGIWLGSIAVIDSRTPWYWAQLLTSPAVAYLAHLSGSVYHLDSFGRPREIGEIYTGIAGLLNLLCVVNAVYMAHCNNIKERNLMMNILNLYQYLLAGFMAPVHIGTTAHALLLALPLIAVIAIVYKATKLDEIKFVSFVREVFLLFGSILVFMIITAIVIFVIMKACCRIIKSVF